MKVIPLYSCILCYYTYLFPNMYFQCKLPCNVQYYIFIYTIYYIVCYNFRLQIFNESVCEPFLRHLFFRGIYYSVCAMKFPEIVIYLLLVGTSAPHVKVARCPPCVPWCLGHMCRSPLLGGRYGSSSTYGTGSSPSKTTSR